MKERRLWFPIVFAAAFVTGANCGSGDSPTEPTPICTFTISPASLSFGSGGGTGTVTVTADAGCTWSASANAGWIAITAGANGSGAGTVAYSVTANGTSGTRNGTLTIAGLTHGVAQEASSPTICTYRLSASSAEFGKDAATGSFAVSAAAGCAWTAVSRVSWVTLSAGQNGSGNGTVSYAVARNGEVSARTGTIAVADQVLTITQLGDTGLCTYSVAPVDLSPCMAGGTVTATVTTQSGCRWTAASNVSWLNLASGASGNGSGAISLRFSDNYDAPRSGIVMVRWPTPTAGQNVRVAQAGCFYAVSRANISVAAAGGTATFDVIQSSEPITCGGATQDRCLWTAGADVPWITITSSMPRFGDNPVAFNVAANNSATARVGRVTVRDKTVVVTQAGR